MTRHDTGASPGRLALFIVRCPFLVALAVSIPSIAFLALLIKAQLGDRPMVMDLSYDQFKVIGDPSTLHADMRSAATAHSYAQEKSKAQQKQQSGQSLIFRPLEYVPNNDGKRIYALETITLVYETVAENGNILTVEALEAIQDMERGLINQAGYVDSYCKYFIDRKECAPPNSILSFLAPSVVNGQVIFDGNGDLVPDLDLALPLVLSGDRLGFTDRYCSADYPRSRTLVTQIPFGAPLDGFSYYDDRKGEQRQIQRKYIDTLEGYLIAADKRAQTMGFRVLRSGGALFTSELNGYISFDLAMSSLSVLGVSCFIWWHTRSLFLTLTGLAGIMLAFPPSIYMLRDNFGVKTNMLNIVSLWILLGIGADDIFVWVDIWRQYPVKPDPNSPHYLKQLAAQLEWTFRRAASAMLVTSFTSASAFYATGTSTILPLRQFGLFMGTLVALNYVIVISYFPACVVMYERWGVRCMRLRKRCCCCACCKPGSSSSSSFSSSSFITADSPTHPPHNKAVEGIALGGVDKDKDKDRDADKDRDRDVSGDGRRYQAVPSLVTSTNNHPGDGEGEGDREGEGEGNGDGRNAVPFGAPLLPASTHDSSSSSAALLVGDEEGEGGRGRRRYGGEGGVVDDEQHNANDEAAGGGRGGGGVPLTRMNRCLIWYHGVVWKARWLLILSWLALVIGVASQIPKIQPPTDIPKFYPVGSNLDLLRNALKSLRCSTCDLGQLGTGAGGGTSTVPVCPVTVCGDFIVTPPPSKAPTKSPTTSSPITNTPTRTNSPTRRPTTLSPTLPPSTYPTTRTPTAYPTFTPSTTTPTRSPITQAPTHSPTSISPTTPTTTAPTASVPTPPPSLNPTTLSPHTGAPTTPPPSTAAPHTLAPITSYPTTKTPTFNPTRSPILPTTQAPITFKPTHAPITERPTSSTLRPTRPPTNPYIPPNESAPISADLSMTITFFWGLSGVDMNDMDGDDRGRPIYNPNFDMSDPAAQLAIVEICDTLQALPQVRPNSVDCLFKQLKAYALTYGAGWPIPQARFITFFNSFIAYTGTDYKVGMNASGTVLTWISVSLVTYVDAQMQGNPMMEQYIFWENIMNSLNARSPSSLGVGFEDSGQWVRTKVELAFISGTVKSLIISLSLIAVSLVIFTYNLHILFLTLLITSSIIACLLGAFAIWEWPLGAVESICVSLMVGLSIDYQLHIGHSFNHSPSYSRFDKSKDALLTIGTPVLAAAGSTVVCVLLLLACSIHIFKVVGTIVATTLLLGIVFTMLAYLPLLMVMGPQGSKSGNLLHYCRVIRRKCCPCCGRGGGEGGGGGEGRNDNSDDHGEDFKSLSLASKNPGGTSSSSVSHLHPSRDNWNR